MKVLGDIRAFRDFGAWDVGFFAERSLSLEFSVFGCLFRVLEASQLCTMRSALDK